LPPSVHVREVLFEDRHLEIVGLIAVLVVDVDQAEELLAQLDFDAVVLPVARAHVDGAVGELDLQIFLQLEDFGLVQRAAP
jgi:hypothetical protein